MTKYVTSSFSLQMIPGGGHLDVEAVDADRAKAFYCTLIPEGGQGDGFVSVGDEIIWRIGHEGTARYFGVPVNRTPITLAKGDQVLVSQPVGERLNPGAEISAPKLSFFIVSVLPPWQPIDNLLRQQILDAEEAEEEEINPERRNFIRNSIQPIKWLLE